MQLAGNYTRLESTDTGPIPYYHGNAPPGRPLNDAAVFVDYLARRWKLSYEYHFIGENFLDPANHKLVPSREIHNAALQIMFLSRALSLTLEGRNLTNNRISDVGGYPLPGRSFFVTMTIRP